MEESPLNFFGAIGRATSSLFGRRGRNKSRGKGNTLSASQLEGARRAFGSTKRNTNPINPINTGMIGAGTWSTTPSSGAGLGAPGTRGGLSPTTTAATSGTGTIPTPAPPSTKLAIML